MEPLLLGLGIWLMSDSKEEPKVETKETITVCIQHDTTTTTKE